MERKTQIKKIEYLNAFCNKKAFKLVCAAFACLVGLLAIYSFVKTPFTGDIKVFMAAANQVKYQDGGWLLSVFEAWELKAIGSRLLMYLVYLLADLIAGFENKIAFECASKLVYALILSGMFAGTAALLPLRNKSRLTVFAVLFFAFFATGTAVQMQVEMTCVAICMLAAACLIHGKTWSFILSGLLGATLFFFKSVFILLFASILIAAALYNRHAEKRIGRRGFIISALSMLGFEAILAVSTYIIYPQEFADMAQASEYQSTLLSEGSAVTLQTITDKLVTNFTSSAVMIPILTLGVIGTIFAVIHAFRQKDHATWLLLLLTWIISLDIIIVSNTYFIYHYFLLVLPSVLGILLYLKAFPGCRYLSLIAAFVSLFAVTVFNVVLGPDYQIGLFNNSTVLLVLLHLFIGAIIVFGFEKFKSAHTIYSTVALTVCFFLWANFLTALAPYYKNLRALDSNSVVMTSRDIPEDIGEDEVLFLDAGSGAFYIDAPSYSRYFFNLPLQRWTSSDKWEWKNEEYEKLLAFEGKYIVIDYNWFNLEKFPELKAKIESEYQELPSDDLRFYSPNWKWNSRIDLDAYRSEKYTTGAHILVRK